MANLAQTKYPNGNPKLTNCITKCQHGNLTQMGQLRFGLEKTTY